MASMQCPQCSRSVSCDGLAPGSYAACPYCGNSLQVPGSLAVAGEVLPPQAAHFRQASLPTIIVVGSKERRLRSGGWFSRAFSATAGVIVAALVFAGLLGTLAVGVLIGGCTLASPLFDAIDDVAKQQAAEQESVLRLSTPLLKRHGIAELSNDAFVRIEGSEAKLVGTGRDASGGLHEVYVEFVVGRFNGKAVYEPRYVQIDGAESH